MTTEFFSKRLTELLLYDHEERFLEFKPPNPWKNNKLEIVRTCLGMANIRDGGTIMIGIYEDKGEFIRHGINNKDLETYKPFDKVKAYINKHVDPYINIKLHPFNWQGKIFLAIDVQEFDEIPVICTSSRGPLNQNAIYTRPHRKPETCIVPSQAEMREIIELAVEKGVRRFIQRKLKRSGISVAMVGKSQRESDAEKFNIQREES